MPKVALGEAEQAILMDRQLTTTDSAELWFTRFWAAKEAVAKAEGTGLRGRPRDFAVIAAEPTSLLVAVAGPDGPRRYTVHCAELHNPPGLPPRHYVVAWTETVSARKDETVAARNERTPRT